MDNSKLHEDNSKELAVEHQVQKPEIENECKEEEEEEEEEVRNGETQEEIFCEKKVEENVDAYLSQKECNNQTEGDNLCNNTIDSRGIDWYYMPDSILLSIFQYLNPKELLTAGEVSRSWNRVSRDELLWKKLFYRTYKVDPSIGIVPGKILEK